MRYIIRKTVLFLLCLAVAAMILPSSAARAARRAIRTAAGMISESSSSV